MTATAQQTAATSAAVGSATRSAARAVLALGAAEVAGKVATFAVMVVAARALGTAGFGAFSYALALALLTSTLVGWGFDVVLTRTGSLDRDALEGAYADLVVLRVVLSLAVLLVTAAVLLGLGRLGTAAAAALLLMSASALLDTLSEAGRAAAAALGRQTGISAVLVVQRLATAAAGIGALLLGLGVVGLATGFVLGSAVGTAAMTVGVARLGVRLRPGTADVRRCRELVRASTAVGVNSIVSTALFRLDSVLLGALAGTLAVGRYAAAYRLLETVMFVNWAVARAVFPHMARATEHWRVRRGVERGTAVCAFVFAPYSVLLLLRGGDVLRLLYGPSYAGRGATVLVWLAFAPLAFGVAYLCAYALYALGRAGAVLVGSVTALTVNFVANLLVLPRYGDVGAAVTTTGSYLLEALVLGALLARTLGVPDLRRALGLPLAAAVPAVLVLRAVQPPVPVAAVLESAVYALAWLALAWRLDREGVAVLRSLVPGVRR